jgi:hypothetical protein
MEGNISILGPGSNGDVWARLDAIIKALSESDNPNDRAAAAEAGN